MDLEHEVTSRACGICVEFVFQKGYQKTWGYSTKSNKDSGNYRAKGISG